MVQIKFKTNIKCTGCLDKLAPQLNDTHGIENWELDLKNPDKVLNVNSHNASEEDIIKAIKKVGFEVEKIR